MIRRRPWRGPTCAVPARRRPHGGPLTLLRFMRRHRMLNLKYGVLLLRLAAGSCVCAGG